MTDERATQGVTAREEDRRMLILTATLSLFLLLAAIAGLALALAFVVEVVVGLFR